MNKYDLNPMEYPYGIEPKNWGQRLTELIELRGEINTSAVAEGAGTSPTSINRWKADSSDISLANAAALAGYLRADPGVLFFGRKIESWVFDDAAAKKDPSAALGALYQQITALSNRAAQISTWIK